jgi:hypothetical protein
MDDAKFIKQLDNIHDPVEALKAIVENEGFMGYDPYYRDLRAALLAMAERVLKEKTK